MKRGTLLAGVAAALVSLTLAGPARAAAVAHLAADSQMQAVIDHYAVVPQGQLIGDRGTVGIAEIVNGPLAVRSDFLWPNDTAVPFLITYDPTKPSFFLTIGEAGSAVTVELPPEEVPLAPFSDIFVRVESLTAGDSVLIDRLSINGNPVPDRAYAGGAVPLDILWISDLQPPLAQGFTMGGMATLTWSGVALPPAPRLTFAVHVGVNASTPAPAIAAAEPAKVDAAPAVAVAQSDESPPTLLAGWLPSLGVIPEPGSLALLGVTLAGWGGLRKLRSWRARRPGAT